MNSYELCTRPLTRLPLKILFSQKKQIGNRTFNAISTISFANKTASYVDIHCPVTDPDLRITLYKLNDQVFHNYEIQCFFGLVLIIA